MLAEQGGAEDPGILSPFPCCGRESTRMRRAPCTLGLGGLVPCFFLGSVS